MAQLVKILSPPDSSNIPVSVANWCYKVPMVSSLTEDLNAGGCGNLSSYWAIRWWPGLVVARWSQSLLYVRPG